VRGDKIGSKRKDVLCWAFNRRKIPEQGKAPPIGSRGKWQHLSEKIIENLKEERAKWGGRIVDIENNTTSENFGASSGIHWAVSTGDSAGPLE
jgi:hypothetical protein